MELKESLQETPFDNSRRKVIIRINESTERKRSELDDSEFGLPELRKYPLNDREHVLAAIRFFNRCPYGYEEELARRIKRKMKEFKISSSIVGHKNNLTRYL